MTGFKKLDTVVPFTGFWLNEIYINNIAKTGSPRACQNLSECCIDIPGRTLQSTSMIYGFHEGGQEIVVVCDLQNFRLYYKDNDTINKLAYDIQVISDKKIKIGSNTFIKTDRRFLEDILFSGEYIDGTGARIQFLKNGQINGLGNFITYEPIYDYMDAGKDVDLINLKENNKTSFPYGFRFNKDTLFIYNLNCETFDSTENVCLESSLGTIKFKLIRVH